MAENKPTQRLDEILVSEGLISEEQVSKALDRQKLLGGKFGSQLLYIGYLDEQSLVHALAIQLNCEGTVLADLEIPEAVLKCIPSEVALARKVIPFAYDVEKNLVKIACEDPNDPELVSEMGFIVRGNDIKLFVAAELALNTAIAANYLGYDVSNESNFLWELPESDTKKTRRTQDQSGSSPVLLVSDDPEESNLVQSLLEGDGYEIIKTDSADDAIEMIGDTRFHTVFIKDTVSGDYLDLIDRLRKTSPGTVVRYYESASNLLLENQQTSVEGELLLKDLELFTGLLASRAGLSENHGGIVGRYVDKLCVRLELPLKDRLAVTNAAYLHNLSCYYNQAKGGIECRRTIPLTAKHLESIGYSPIVVQILRSMYIDLKGKYTKRLPIEVLGGNIVTIVDLFCDHVSVKGRISLDRFEALREKYHRMVGKLFLAEVVEPFLEMIQEEVLDGSGPDSISQIMILSDSNEVAARIEARVKGEGLRTILADSFDDFIGLYRRSRPSLAIVALIGGTEDVKAKMGELSSQGVSFVRTPTFLLVDADTAPELISEVEQEIEDVLPLEANLDLLVAKLRRTLSNLVRKTGVGYRPVDRIDPTRGRLSDMNLIDLLQAMGPSQRTARITVTPNGSSEKLLTIYLDGGKIRCASIGDKTGPEAVYEGLRISDGSWIIEPVDPDNLPEANNELSNESILMEGCRRLDHSNNELKTA